jgi:hypothetical protein
MLFDKNPTTETKEIAQIFNSTVSTYKYYWFVSILDIVVKEQRRQMSFWEVIAGMVAEAWYPIHYFRLSFGKSDSFYTQIIEIQQELKIPIDAKKEIIKNRIIENIHLPKIKSILNVFKANVPYRFLSPWIKYSTDKQVSYLSQSYTNNCLYLIKDNTIEINPLWIHYINVNYLILKDYAYWNLAEFIQKRNPNVPDITSKLVKPITRNALTNQRKFWNTYIEIKGPMPCIYSHKLLEKKTFDLDHFIPWSYITTDLLWNIIPANHEANISKSDNLPILKNLLPQFARQHQLALKEIYAINHNNTILEDYLTIYDSVPELIHLSENDFLNVFQKTFSPMVQIAENMGFKYWQNKFQL